MIGTEEEVAERVKRFADAGVDRMIVSPMHGSFDENVRTLEKLADMVGAGSPA
jgi:alkanesulfonate monooxygenase SsuD/methylene tetrahydromethanopterin reductase-like flavin-dependent oxidoreductase (luciferase family)